MMINLGAIIVILLVTFVFYILSGPGLVEGKYKIERGEPPIPAILKSRQLAIYKRDGKYFLKGLDKSDMMFRNINSEWTYKFLSRKAILTSTEEGITLTAFTNNKPVGKMFLKKFN